MIVSLQLSKVFSIYGGLVVFIVNLNSCEQDLSYEIGIVPSLLIDVPITGPPLVI